MKKLKYKLPKKNAVQHERLTFRKKRPWNLIPGPYVSLQNSSSQNIFRMIEEQ